MRTADLHVSPDDTAVSSPKMAALTEMLFGLWTRVKLCRRDGQGGQRSMTVDNR